LEKEGNYKKNKLKTRRGGGGLKLKHTSHNQEFGKMPLEQ